VCRNTMPSAQPVETMPARPTTTPWRPAPGQISPLMASLVADAVAAHAAMSPVDRALHDADRRRSFGRGMGTDPGPNVLAEEVRRLRALVTQLGGDPHVK